MDLLILGASTRAAAASAVRIGLKPTCADLFADADLAAIAPVTRIDPGRYPDSLLEFADSIEPTDWFYTGAIENRPDLVDAISRRHRLLGNPGATLERVRDPVALARVVRDSGLSALEVQLDPSGLPLDGTWLRKPLASGGGQGIRPWVRGLPPASRPCYFQERVEGLPLASIHVADPSGARCLGISRQFVGRPGQRFAYRGSLAPWPVPGEVLGRVAFLGQVLASHFGLIGIFGVDLILARGQPWLVEVNPRYTASVETLEWASGRSILRDHLQACGREVAGPVMTDFSAGRFVAKRVVFAHRVGVWRENSGLFQSPTRFPDLADIPRDGSRFEPGEPILTVFGRGDTLEGCRTDLARNAWPYRRL